MKGSITRRQLKGGLQYYIVYDAGRKWSSKKQKTVRNQQWERVEPNTRTAAQKLLNIRLAEVQRGEWQGKQSIGFTELTQSWMEKDARPRLKPQSLDRYQQFLRLHILPVLGQYQAHEIDLEILQGFTAVLLQELSVSHVKSIVAVTRAILRKGYEWGYVKANPADMRISYPRHTPKKIDPLTPEEIHALLAQASQKWCAVLVVAIWTGLRVGEIQAMKWNNLDWKASEYYVEENLTRRRGFGDPKTPSAASSVLLSPFVIDTLRQHKQRQAALKLAQGSDYKDAGFIFTTDQGGPYGYNQITKWGLERTLEDAGLRRITFHQLRHTCASLLISKGANIKSVQRQLRHATIKQTLDTYAHLYPDDHAEAVRAMDSYVWGKAAQLTNI